MTDLSSSEEFYSFEYSDGEAKHLSMSFSPGDTWPEVLDQFVSFMSNVYGYDIHQKVGIAYSPLRRYSLVDTWTGPVFNPEDNL